MDKSPDSFNLGTRPLAPWLRLAHVSGSSTGEAKEARARLRKLLDFELVLPLSGQCWLYWEPGGGSVDLSWGQCAFIPPDGWNGWAQVNGAHIAVHFDFHAQPRLAAMKNLRYSTRYVARTPLQKIPWFEISLDSSASLRIPLVTRLSNPRLWRERLDPLVQWYTRRAPRTLEAQLQHAEIIGWAVRTLAADAAKHAGSLELNASDARILELLRELDDATAGTQKEGALPLRPSVEELAERARMGLTTFREAFQRTTGRAPREFLEERRLERAARAILETQRGVAEIARAEGYDDPYHFSRAFKRVLGKSPRAYRRALEQH